MCGGGGVGGARSCCLCTLLRSIEVLAASRSVASCDADEGKGGRDGQKLDKEDGIMEQQITPLLSVYHKVFWQVFVCASIVTR